MVGLAPGSTGDALAVVRRLGDGGLAGVTRMSSAYRLHPTSYYSSPSRLHPKVGAALAFILFGSIVGASGFMLQTDGPEPFRSGRPAMTAASPKPGTAHAPAAPPAPAVSAPTSPPSAPAQTAPAATMVAAAEPAPMGAPEPAPPAAIELAEAEAAVAAATEPPPPPAVADMKAKKKAARSQGRRDRGWYDAYAWSPQRAGSGSQRGYGHDYARPLH